MRNAVINEIERMAESDGRIAVMTADLGYSVLESFAARFPDRFYNVGISEQLMASAAAGIALSGCVVFTYSIGNFATLRCIEQIRNDICYHDANVKIIAVGGGFSYGQLGMSHHATEDIAMLRALPNMHVLAPADPEEALAAVRYAVGTEGPFYIRSGRTGGGRDLRRRIQHSLREAAGQGSAGAYHTPLYCRDHRRGTCHSRRPWRRRGGGHGRYVRKTSETNTVRSA